MVQMLAQPPDFAIYIYSSDAFTFPLKNKLYEILNQQPRRLVGVVDLKFRTEGIALP